MGDLNKTLSKRWEGIELAFGDYSQLSGAVGGCVEQDFVGGCVEQDFTLEKNPQKNLLQTKPILNECAEDYGRVHITLYFQLPTITWLFYFE